MTSFGNFVSASALILLLSPVSFIGCSRQNSATDADAKFAEQAAAGGMAEVRLGQLAQERGNSVAVKDFGSQMVADHTEAGNKLQVVARQSNVSLPSDMTAEDRALYSKLSGLSGTAFDQAYSSAMVNDHEADVADFEKEASQGKVTQIRQFATDTLPTLRTHLEKARQLQKTVLAAANF